MTQKNSWITLMIVLALLGITDLASAKEAIKTPKQLVASGHPEWPPVMFEKGKNIIGAGPELVGKIFGDLGVKISIPYSGPWEDVIAKSKSGDIDIVVAAYKTKERKKYFIYSDAYTTDPVAVFVPSDKAFKFENFSDLVGKSGVGMIGDSYGQEFDDYSATHLKVQRVQTVAEGFEKLTKHQADYFIYSLYGGKLEIKKKKLSKITSLPHLVSEQPFYVMISKKSPFTHDIKNINRLLKKYKEDGTIDALVKKYE